MPEQKKTELLSPISCLRVISVAIVTIIVLLIIITIILQPQLLDPFPAYLGSKPLSSGETTSYPVEGLLSFQCLSNPLYVKKWQVFTTSDNPNQVHAFFAQQAQHMSKAPDESNAYNPFLESRPLFSNIFCYIVTQARFFPINIVIILDHQNTKDMNIIQQAFPNIASNLNVIITIQGYMPAE